MNMIEAAQGYVSQGWKVFPLRPRSKKPLPGTHGKDDATGDPAQVQRWWQAMANANIAVACGATSGIIVIDLDAIDDTNAHDGQATWQKLASHYGDIETRQQRTGGGGLQLFFLHPGAGVEISNRAQLLPGIDVRGDGGYTVVGPSIHPDTGKAYEWTNDIEPQQPPIWLLGILFDDDARLEALKIAMPDEQLRLAWSKESWSKSPELRTAQPAKALPTGPTVSADSDEMKRWLTVTMDKAYQAVASAPKGSRNAVLNRETYSLAGLMPYISRDEIERLMLMAAEKSGYVADDGEAAVNAAIKSAIDSGSRAPRQLPELTPARPAVVVPEMETGGEFTPNDDGTASPIATGESVRPWIQVNNVELPDITEASIKALAKLGGTFVRSNELVRVRIDEKNRAGIETMSEAALRGRMARAAVYYTERYNAKTDSRSETIVAPPVNAVQDVMTVGDWPFPALDGVIESPTMRPDGSIVLAPGYDAATRLYLVMSPGLELPAIPNEPEQADVEAALALLADMFVDMPFEDAASRANALGALLTPIARPMIAGPVPMPIFDSPQQGSGKTLTAQLIGLVATGEMPEPSPAPDAPEEWRKSISAQLGAARSVILIDNITRTLEDGSLAAVLTSTTWSDRLLGRNDKQIKLPARACWMATGNNVKVGGDLITRTYLVRLDAKMSRPQERDGFKHPNIEQWVKANRGLLLKAALVLCRAWHVAGRPAPTCPRIRYGEWRTVIGGILQHAGVNEFLGNLRTFQEASDVEGPAWERFILKLIEVFGATVAPAQIYARFAASDDLAALLPPELAGKLSSTDDHKAKSQFASRIGYLFRDRIGKRFGDSQACVVRSKRTSDGMTWELKSGD